MVEWLSNTLHTLINFFQSIGNLIGNIIDKIESFFSIVASVFEFVTSCFALIPSYYIAFGVIIITILVVFLFIGREPGGD